MTAAASCASVTYSTATGSTFANLPIDLSVTFVTSTDNTQNPTADTQAISGISYTINTALLSTPTLPSAPQGTGNLITIGSTLTAAVADNNTADVNHWRVQNLGTSGATTNLNLDIFTGGSPHNLVIGSAPGGIYSNANNSVTNAGHNPYVLTTASFVITLPGVTSTTTVSNVVFNVGTAQNQATTQALSAVPEPGTLRLMLVAAVPFGVFLRKRRNTPAR